MMHAVDSCQTAQHWQWQFMHDAFYTTDTTVAYYCGYSILLALCTSQDNIWLQHNILSSANI